MKSSILKSILILVFLIVLNSSSYSQTVAFNKGAKIERLEQASFRFLEIDNDSIYVYRVDNYQCYLEVFDRDSIQRRNVIRIPLEFIDSSYYNIEKIFLRGDTISLIYSYFDNKNLCETLEMMQLNHAGKLLNSIQKLDLLYGKKQSKAGYFLIRESSKEQQFYSYGMKFSNNEVKGFVNEYNFLGNTVDSNSFTLDNNRRILDNPVFDNHSNLYYLTKDGSKLNGFNWDLIIYSLEKKTIDVNLLPLLSCEKFFLADNSVVSKSENGVLNLFFLYKLEKSSYECHGLYVIQIDEKKLVVSNEIAIPFRRIEGDKDIYKSSIVDYSGMLINLIQLDSNKTRITLESKIHRSSNAAWMPLTFIAMGIIGVGILYHNEEEQRRSIFTIDINKSMEITEVHKVRKDQIAKEYNEKYIGFATLNDSKSVYYLYNDLPKNLNRVPKKQKAVTNVGFKSTQIVSLSDINGKIEKNVILSKKSKKEISAILPNINIQDTKKGELFSLQQIDSTVFLTKYFIKKK
jgi:hypothetical protein